MAKPIVSDELWKVIEPLIPELPRRFRHPGRKRLDDRKVLTGILFVLQTGIGWERLPQEMGCGSGMTCWRRPEGVERPGRLAAAARGAACQVAFRRADRLVARGHRQLPGARGFGGLQRGPSPVDRGRAGSKHHLITDGGGVPLVASVTAANRNDITEMIGLVDKVPPVRSRCGRPKRRPKRLLAVRAYWSKVHHRELRARHIVPNIAAPKSPHGSGLGKERWVVERSLSWQHQHRRLRIRWERRDDIHEAFVSIARSLICFKQLQLAGSK
jgi:transposase